jgi:hypothetical protein
VAALASGDLRDAVSRVRPNASDQIDGRLLTKALITVGRRGPDGALRRTFEPDECADLRSLCDVLAAPRALGRFVDQAVLERFAETLDEQMGLHRVIPSRSRTAAPSTPEHSSLKLQDVLRAVRFQHASAATRHDETGAVIDALHLFDYKFVPESARLQARRQWHAGTELHEGAMPAIELADMIVRDMLSAVKEPTLLSSRKRQKWVRNVQHLARYAAVAISVQELQGKSSISQQLVQDLIHATNDKLEELGFAPGSPLRASDFVTNDDEHSRNSVAVLQGYRQETPSPLYDRSLTALRRNPPSQPAQRTADVVARQTVVRHDHLDRAIAAALTDSSGEATEYLRRLPAFKAHLLEIVSTREAQQDPALFDDEPVSIWMNHLDDVHTDCPLVPVCGSSILSKVGVARARSSDPTQQMGTQQTTDPPRKLTRCAHDSRRIKVLRSFHTRRTCDTTSTLPRRRRVTRSEMRRSVIRTVSSRILRHPSPIPRPAGRSCRIPRQKQRSSGRERDAASRLDHPHPHAVRSEADIDSWIRGRITGCRIDPLTFPTYRVCILRMYTE